MLLPLLWACAPPPPAQTPEPTKAAGQRVTATPEVTKQEVLGRAALPRIVSNNGRHALLVDGAPYLLLCAQTNNSSNSPLALPEVWKMVEALGANTLQIPISWEQVEPVEGQYDFSFLDLLLDQARRHDVRLVPLWFGAFKNTSPSYAPSWVKLDNERFPRMVRADGDNHYALSPHTPALLEAEKRAFSAFMRHLSDRDPRHTVILVQVENEVGVYGLVRDHGPVAEQLFQSPAPDALVKKLGVKSGTWQEAFGADAAEYFTAYAFASYVGELARTGREILDLPMYTNAALRHPTKPQQAGSYATGGPTHNVLDIWKVGAPALDLLTPDIYLSRSEDYLAAVDHYARPDNPLFVSETGAQAAYPRYFFEALGRGAIGFSPFGMDDADYVSHPPDVSHAQADATSDFAANFALVGSAAREWARLSFDNEIWGVARPDDNTDRFVDLGRFRAEISFDEWPFGYRSWLPPGAEGLKEPSEFTNSGVLIARLGSDTFVMTGKNARIEFSTNEEVAPGQKAIIVAADEVEFRDGLWEKRRRMNGDQTDYGLNFTELSQTFRVKLSTYPARNDSRSRPQAIDGDRAK